MYLDGPYKRMYLYDSSYIYYNNLYIESIAIACMGLLKTIAISTENYRILKNMGKTADSFNDVITHLIKKAGTLDEQ